MMNRKIKLWTTLLISLLTSTSLYAYQHIDEQLFSVARSGELAQLEQLLNQGTDVNKTNSQGFTALMLAAYYGHTPLIERLIQSGAQTCTIDNKGSSAMMGAAFRGHLKVVQWLLENSGCDVNQRNHVG